MKTSVIALFALLALQASASWVIIEGYDDAGCSGTPDSINAYEEGECYSRGDGAIKFEDGTYMSYSANNCDGTASDETDVGDSCEDTDNGSGIVVASGLSTPVNADYPLTQATFPTNNDDCDHLDMTTLYTTTSADDMEDVDTGCEDVDLLGISVKTEFTSTGYKSTTYTETGCTGTSSSTEITFGECEESTNGYTIMYYSAGSMILASISALFAIIGFALMG
mmetsp:Transcript_38611/g.34329  ORF Transcript_38611/g.34329 Transcript_38611/m.34329 type:complete len:223 (+) Transcript_38611:140-808(+)